MALVVVMAVAIALIARFGGGSPSAGPTTVSRPGGSGGSAPPLEQLCSSTSPSATDPNAPAQPPASGPQIVDRSAHISYARLPAPFTPWDQGVWGQDQGSLGETFAAGEYFVTEMDYAANEPYLASVLSGTVPATYGDDPHPNIECAANVVTEDVRKSYYPQPNTIDSQRSKQLTVSGRPAYENEFHLTFAQHGLKAHGELVSVCVIDVPGNRAALVYISIPDTQRRYDSVVATVLASIRVVS